MASGYLQLRTAGTRSARGNALHAVTELIALTNHESSMHTAR